MAGGVALQKKRKRDNGANSAAGGSVQRKKRKQVVDSDGDDGGSSVFQPSSPTPSSSRRYAKSAPRPSAQVASSFIAKRRGVPEEIDLEDSDDDLPDLATIIASSQPTQRPSQSTSKPTKKGTEKASSDSRGKGKNKAPYRRPTGTLVNLGTFELDENGNDVEELKRKRERKLKRRREEEDRRRRDDSESSVVQCASPPPRARARQRASKPEVIVLDSEGDEIPTPAPAPRTKRQRRSSPSPSPTPCPRSPSPPRGSSPYQPVDLEPSVEILSAPPSPKPSSQPEQDPEPEVEPVTYNPGDLQALYDQELQKVVERARTLKTIVPRRKHKVFRRARSVDPAFSHPTYTGDYGEAPAVVTALLWSRSDPFWASASSSNSARDTEDTDSMGLDAIPEAEEARDELQAVESEDLVADNAGSSVSAQPQDVLDELVSPASGDTLATESPCVPATCLDYVATEDALQDTPAPEEQCFSPMPPSEPSIATASTADIPEQLLSTTSSPTVDPPPPSALPPSCAQESPLQSEENVAAIQAAMAVAQAKYKPSGQDEFLLRVVLLDVFGAMKAQDAKDSEASQPTVSSRQSSATLASQSSDETELSSPGPITPVHSVTADPIAGLASMEDGGTVSKPGDDIDSLVDDDDSLSIAGSSFELGYPD